MTEGVVGGFTLVVQVTVTGGATLVVTGGVVDGGSVTTVVLFTLGVVRGTSGFVPTASKKPGRTYKSCSSYIIFIYRVRLTC